MNPLNTAREIPATINEVFAAISDPQRLARWWGPAGFTNTFEVCEFKPGGRWVFTMHGPDGRNYPNESVFIEIDSPRRVVIQHVCDPKFSLTIAMTPTPTGTRVSWTQLFENPGFPEKMFHILVPANEQNLDRLTTEVAGGVQ